MISFYEKYCLLISKIYAKPDIFYCFFSFELYFQAFSTVPKVHVTVHHGPLDQIKKDVMNIWIQSISRGQMEVCLRESRTFDGPHSNLKVVCHNFRINELNMQAGELVRMDRTRLTGRTVALG